MVERAVTVKDVAGMRATPITATVKTFCELSGLGRTKVFEMLKDGTLESVKIVNCRLIIMESYLRLVRSLRTASNGGNDGGKA